MFDGYFEMLFGGLGFMDVRDFVLFVRFRLGLGFWDLVVDCFICCYWKTVFYCCLRVLLVFVVL